MHMQFGEMCESEVWAGLYIARFRNPRWMITQPNDNDDDDDYNGPAADDHN